MTPTIDDGRVSSTTSAAPLLHILAALDARSYEFVTPTRATHALISRRLDRALPGSLRDVFGWCRPFGRDDLESDLLQALEASKAVERLADGLMRSRLRVARLDDQLYVHSAPSGDPDAVFLGPDSYRFARFIRSVAGSVGEVTRAVDIGTGAGVGAMTLASLWPCAEVWAGDINTAALDYVRANALHAGLDVRAEISDGLSGLKDHFDLIVANPPFIAGSGGRTYRDGGAHLGAQVTLRWMQEAVARLRPGGSIVLYTGSPIIDGDDRLKHQLTTLGKTRGLALQYDELDPDVFGSMLRRDDYRTVERIALVGATLR